MQRQFRTGVTSVEGIKGTWWKVGQSVYALWVAVSGTNLSITSRERVSGDFVLLSRWLLMCWT